jgi:Fe-S cluster biogenesis protein NfuA
VTNGKGEVQIMKEKVQKAIDRIRPNLQADGGDVELIDVGEDGACHGCPMAQMTLKNGIEKFLKQEVPEVQSVVSV